MIITGSTNPDASPNIEIQIPTAVTSRPVNQICQGSTCLDYWFNLDNSNCLSMRGAEIINDVSDNFTLNYTQCSQMDGFSPFTAVVKVFV
jgi:hypothetical protein